MIMQKRSEELARSSGDRVESASNIGNNSSGSKGSNTNLHQLSVTDSSSVAYVDEFDTSIITLNTVCFCNAILLNLSTVHEENFSGVEYQHLC